jgi:hypothetical protein
VFSTPVTVSAGEIWLSEDGEVVVAAARRAESEEAACRGLVELVGQLLVQSAPGVPSGLLSLVEHGPSSGEWTLRSLRDDLEAALVPLNRAATRRVLSRLLRETRRERASTRCAASPDEGTLQDELDDLLGVDKDDPGLSQEASAPRPVAAAAQGPAPRLEGFEPDSATELDAALVGEPAPHAKVERKAAVRQRKGAGPIAARVRPRLNEAHLDDFDRAAQGRVGLRVGVALGVAALLLVAAYLWLGRDAARQALGLQEAEPPAAALQPPPAAPKPEYGELTVTSTPARAQVLLYVGAGPATADDLPVGIAHEFVALAEGAAPARAVVPPDASWQDEGGQLRYELALQTSPATKQKPADDLGATMLPQQVGAPKGALGKVRVITSPPGAKVYLLIGFTPDVRVDTLKPDEEIELLLYQGGYALERVTVGKDAYSEEEGELIARVDVELKPR